jgi:putative NADH-flavin reductase
VDILKQYLSRADEIIGERTPDEQKYDREVIRWMRRGKSVTKAIARANEKYPAEALQVDNDNLADVQAHFEYLAEHDAIIGKFDALK